MAVLDPILEDAVSLQGPLPILRTDAVLIAPDHPGPLIRRAGAEMRDGDVFALIAGPEVLFFQFFGGDVFVIPETELAAIRPGVPIGDILDALDQLGDVDPAAQAAIPSEPGPPVSELQQVIERLLAQAGHERDVLQSGLHLLYGLRQILEYGLDLAEMEAELLADAADLAVDQVQDMRIKWLEEGPEVTLPETLFAAMMMPIFEISVATAVSNLHRAPELIARGLRSWQRSAVNAQILSRRQEIRRRVQQLQKDLGPKVTLSQELRLVWTASSGRAAHARLRVAAAANPRLNPRLQRSLNRVPVGQRSAAQQRAATERALAPERQRAAAAGAQEREDYYRFEAVQEEVDRTRSEIEKFSQQLARMRPVVPLRAQDVLDAAAAQVRNTHLSSVYGTFAGQFAKELVGKAAAARPTGPTARRQPDRSRQPPTGEAFDKDGYNPAFDPAAGDSPSTLIRSRVLTFRRVLRQEIGAMRRLATQIVDDATLVPESLDVALPLLRKLTLRMTWPERSPGEYQEGLRALAREFEFSIWAIYLNLWYAYTGQRDDLAIGWDIEGADERVIDYLFKRFTAQYEHVDTHKHHKRYGKLTDALHERKRLIEQGSERLQELAYGRVVDTAIFQTRAGILREAHRAQPGEEDAQ